MKEISLLVIPATFLLASFQPTAERIEPDTIEIMGADFVRIQPTAEVIEGEPIKAMDGAYGQALRMRIDPYKDYRVYTYTLPADGYPASPMRTIEMFDLTLTPEERLNIAVLNMFHWKEQVDILMGDQSNGLDYFHLAEAIRLAKGED